MSQHNVISYHGLCVTTIVASLLHTMCLCILNDIEGLQLKHNLPKFHWVHAVIHTIKSVIQDAQACLFTFFCTTPSYHRFLTTYSVALVWCIVKNTIRALILYVNKLKSWWFSLLLLHCCSRDPVRMVWFGCICGWMFLVICQCVSKSEKPSGDQLIYYFLSRIHNLL